ncbi:MAG: DUF4783 domain-containing protein [bacterium]
MLVILMIVYVVSADAQIRSLIPRRQKKESVSNTLTDRNRPPVAQVRELFSEIEREILESAIGSSSDRFARQVLVNVHGSEGGYYSANQAASIIRSYFIQQRPSSFSFSRFHDDGSPPFAIGRLTFVKKGVKEYAQVYVSLVKQQSQWVINQFNIY